MTFSQRTMATHEWVLHRADEYEGGMTERIEHCRCGARRRRWLTTRGGQVIRDVVVFTDPDPLQDCPRQNNETD
ncbi:MAG: hypothetical protein F4X62_14900 [Caldilineaceae bacterium SB0662_bin_25]|nr:hypothetical protein [Caldilineaceae bacterium SB0662_bin_25]